MKKIISLLASIAMLATMVTSVSAATLEANNPVFSTVVEEIDADAFETYTDGELLEDGQVAYMISTSLTGLDLSVKVGGTGSTKEKKTRAGLLLAAVDYQIDWDSDVDFYAEDTDITESDAFCEPLSGMRAYQAPSDPADMSPIIKNSETKTVTADSVYLYSFVVVTDGTTPLQGTVKGGLTLKTFEMGQADNGDPVSKQTGLREILPANAAYEVNGVAGKTITLGASAPVENVVVTPVVDTENVITEGKAWNVVINTYDDAKTYKAIFTNLDEEDEAKKTKEHDLDFSKIGEIEGKFTFVTLLKTLKQNVTLNVTEN